MVVYLLVYCRLSSTILRNLAAVLDANLEHDPVGARLKLGRLTVNPRTTLQGRALSHTRPIHPSWATTKYVA